MSKLRRIWCALAAAVIAAVLTAGTAFAAEECYLTWDEYVEFVMDDLKEEDPELIATIHAGKFPGVLIRGTNNSGAYLYGEIMINSYAYGFYFYLLNEDGSVNSNITQEEIDLFWSIVETFVPVLTGYTPEA